MSNNEYPLKDFLYFIANSGSDMAMLTKAYDLGKEHALADPGDWHNLTGAIKAGEPIDFEKLDGRKIRLTKGQAVVEDVLEQNNNYRLYSYHGGWKCSVFKYFAPAWHGEDDWTLWVDGEIPMRKQTADTLPFGTSFKDSHGHEYVVVAHGRVQALYGNCNVTPAKNIVVNEIFGMYGQKESE